MNKKVPEIFVNKINKINNNKEVYYSYYDKEEQNINIDPYNIRVKINKLFQSKDFVYKKKFHIKTKYDEKDYVIVSKNYDYLITINGDKIYIDNILEIN